MEKARLGERFIHCFNAIDQGLRVKYDFNRSMGFSELIRKTVPLNYIVRKYEDDLIDYGRLRNAIVHHSKEDMLIAEPHLSVVETMEKIEALLNKPDLVVDTPYCCREVLRIDGNVAMQDVIKKIAKSGYSNLPVYHNGKLIGVANGQKIIDVFGIYLESGGKAKTFLENMKIEDILERFESKNFYELKSVKLTVDEAILEFSNNPRLRAVLISQNGNEKEIPFAIVTPADIIEMNKLLF